MAENDMRKSVLQMYIELLNLRIVVLDAQQKKIQRDLLLMSSKRKRPRRR